VRAGSVRRERQGGFPWRSLFVGGGLPGLVGDGVAAVYGEVVGFVGVVLVVGIEGADTDHVFGGKVGDGDGLAGLGICAGVDGGGGQGSELAEGPDPGAGLCAAVGADEVVLEAAVDGAELCRGGGVGDDAVGRGREGRAGMRLVVARGGGCGRGRGCGGLAAGGAVTRAWTGIRRRADGRGWGRCSGRRIGGRASDWASAGASRRAWRALRYDGCGHGNCQEDYQQKRSGVAQVFLESRCGFH